jgi:hypothetical protein
MLALAIPAAAITPHPADRRRFADTEPDIASLNINSLHVT